MINSICSMKNIVYIGFLSNNIYEGGMARNNAFFLKFETLKSKSLNIYNTNSILRILNSIYVLIYLLLSKKKTIFIHQSALLALFPIRLYKSAIFQRKIKAFLSYLAFRNSVILEVNDLPYEQAIDLKLKVNPLFAVFENLVYSIPNWKYLFASYEMEKFVRKKYNLQAEYTQVIINGAPELCKLDVKSHLESSWTTLDKIKFVYAGSLNKGRQIEELISFFQTQNNSVLILMGNDGEWISEVSIPNNVYYIGNYNEKEAHFLTSKCDLGLIPYDENLFYYNLCYPTKMSFYITAGIPVLCTPLIELQNIFGKSKNIIFSSFENWPKEIAYLTNENINQLKKSSNMLQNKYTWDVLLNNLKL